MLRTASVWLRLLSCITHRKYLHVAKPVLVKVIVGMDSKESVEVTLLGFNWVRVSPQTQWCKQSVFPQRPCGFPWMGICEVGKCLAITGFECPSSEKSIVRGQVP